MTDRLSDERLRSLRAENEQLRKRCSWLQERRAVLRKLLAAKWSKRKEVRRMRAHIEELNAATSNAIGEALDLRAKLSAGPVMPVADLYALCEATKEQTYDSDNEFNRGRYFEAKHIAKAVMAAGY